MQFPSLDQLEEDYKRKHPPDFITHAHYIKFLKDISENLIIKCNLKIGKKIPESKILLKKINLLKLTLLGIRAEYEIILKNPDYAVVCVSWISVKSYYVFFNLLLILKYLITGAESSFSASHTGVLDDFRKHIENKDLLFNKEEFNKNYKCRNILGWVAKPGANIRSIGVDAQERLLQIIKILMRYKIEEFKRREGIKTLRKKIAQNFLDNSTINICEFFYWYRIKANYRDLEFLNKEIDDSQFRDFYCDYYNLMMFFYTAFQNLINELSAIRLGKNILN